MHSCMEEALPGSTGNTDMSEHPPNRDRGGSEPQVARSFDELLEVVLELLGDSGGRVEVHREEGGGGGGQDQATFLVGQGRDGQGHVIVSAPLDVGDGRRHTMQIIRPGVGGLRDATAAGLKEAIFGEQEGVGETELGLVSQVAELVNDESEGGEEVVVVKVLRPLPGQKNSFTSSASKDGTLEVRVRRPQQQQQPQSDLRPRPRPLPIEVVEDIADEISQDEEEGEATGQRGQSSKIFLTEDNADQLTNAVASIVASEPDLTSGELKVTFNPKLKVPLVLLDFQTEAINAALPVEASGTAVPGGAVTINIPFKQVYRL